jgi:hypothetical protein
VAHTRYQLQCRQRDIDRHGEACKSGLPFSTLPDVPVNIIQIMRKRFLDLMKVYQDPEAQRKALLLDTFSPKSKLTDDYDELEASIDDLELSELQGALSSYNDDKYLRALLADDEELYSETMAEIRRLDAEIARREECGRLPQPLIPEIEEDHQLLRRRDSFSH